ncbi:class I adenylate-forming enzyme family protein [Sphingosinicella rhizophila]|uniref:Class I adenylate-forming enzyme family protein n=1 Tax=Sphingosinicella rhizophila TaxID=3050082 RepID=A0ABU3Q611_9SPHN|nr:class I adenylate-forming enzyme family protein [Sphingosinicella sp. GR2756]MDT9598848.1 class I adenylate-forming enzyme family protein [Sphingosinicella sp. GR2756]
MTLRTHGSGLRLDGILSHAAASDPERTAIIFGDLTRTYAQVSDRARRFATVLAGLGVVKGDRVALWAPNRPEFLEIIFGIPLLGAIAVPLDHWWEKKDALAALGQMRPKVLVVAAALASHLAGSDAELEASGIEHILSLDEASDSGHLSYARRLADAEPLVQPVSVAEDDPALILFTSGSTGRSKGAVHTHRGLCTTAMVMGLELGLRDGERTLHFLPLFSSCLEHLIPLTLVRGTHVIMPHFDARGAWEAIEAHGITHVDAVPTTLRRLIEHIPAKVPASLRLISYASEPMPPQLITQLAGLLPDTEFVQFYGMIEQLCLTVQGPSRQIPKLGTVGRPMIGAELRILGEDGEPGSGDEPGEIIARSPTLFAGYWQDPNTTAQVMRDGWMRTGDIGRIDEDGFLVLSGRVKEVIKSGGVTVIPSEVEAALLSHESVREAAVVGVPDDNWGEAVHAFVVLHLGAEMPEKELLAFCRQQLAGYKTPKSVHFVGDLPRTGIGKIARREVRDQFLRAQTSEVAA